MERGNETQFSPSPTTAPPEKTPFVDGKLGNFGNTWQLLATSRRMTLKLNELQVI
jgi:hypothetical protein